MRAFCFLGVDSTVMTLEKLHSDANAIFENIEWNFGALVMAGAIINKPSIINVHELPHQIVIDGIVLKSASLFGLNFPSNERRARVGEILALAQRSLICEATEMAADLLHRAAVISSGKPDPYKLNTSLSIKLRDFSVTRRGKAGSLLNKAQRDFMSECAVPLRGFIRHNNAKIPSNRGIDYCGSPCGIDICVQHRESDGGASSIKINLDQSHAIYTSIHKLVNSAFEKAMAISRADE